MKAAEAQLADFGLLTSAKNSAAESLTKSPCDGCRKVAANRPSFFSNECITTHLPQESVLGESQQQFEAQNTIGIVLVSEPLPQGEGVVSRHLMGKEEDWRYDVGPTAFSPLHITALGVLETRHHHAQQGEGEVPMLKGGERMKDFKLLLQQLAKEILEVAEYRDIEEASP